MQTLKRGGDGNEVLRSDDAASGSASSTPSAYPVCAAFNAMEQALLTTEANIRSLGPAGAIPTPYHEWLRVVEGALAQAAKLNDDDRRAADPVEPLPF